MKYFRSGISSRSPHAPRPDTLPSPAYVVRLSSYTLARIQNHDARPFAGQRIGSFTVYEEGFAMILDVAAGVLIAGIVIGLFWASLENNSGGLFAVSALAAAGVIILASLS